MKINNVIQSSKNNHKQNLSDLKDINFEDLDEDVKNRMISKVENLKNTWEEFIKFEKYHKKVFINNPYIINLELNKSNIELNKRKSIFETTHHNSQQNRTSESFRVPFNNNPFSPNIQSNQAESPNPNNQFAHADMNHTSHVTKSDHNTINSNEKGNEPVVLPYLNDDLIKKYRNGDTSNNVFDIFDLKLEDTVYDMKPKMVD